MRSHRPSLPGQRHAHGFTLIEVMVVVALLGILSAFAVPSLQTYLDRNRVRSFSNDLFASLQYAKAEALARGGGVRVCPIFGGGSNLDCPTRFADRPKGRVNCIGDYFSDGWKIITASEVLRAIKQPLPDGLTVCLNGNSRTSKTIELGRLGQPAEPFVGVSILGKTTCRVIVIEQTGLIVLYPENKTKYNGALDCYITP